MVLCIYKQNIYVYEALDICTLIHLCIILFHMKYRMQIYFKGFLFMSFILVCAVVYRTRIKATWKLKSVLQMHLHRCHVLTLFVLFKSIYMVTYQNLSSSRISQQGQGERESREVMVHDISSNLLTVIPLQGLFIVIALLLNLTP